jgi:DUF4097 and DUF4098 domain-containing protein YvlB
MGDLPADSCAERVRHRPRDRQRPPFSLQRGRQIDCPCHQRTNLPARFFGYADVRAANGPITITGSSGNVRIHTENGPISINLQGTTWSGAGLTADAQNGPLTLSVPSDYKSSFSVESRNYSPMSCHASICDNARKTWDDNNRRIEYGSSPAMIKLSTVNGPVSIQSSRGEM